MTLIRVVDTETTGIEEPAEMVEAGWTDVHITGSGQIIIDPSGPRSRLVRPGVPISFGAMAVHHISEAMVEAGDDPDAIRAKLAYGADILCAHNAAFDRRFIRGHNLPWICTFKGARTVWPELQSHSNGAIRYERGLCLHDARAMPSHRAGPDTWITAHILADLLSSVSVDQLIEICNNPVLQKKVGFGEHAGKLWADVPDSYLDWILNKSTMPSDPKKEDAVFTARAELARRGVKAELPSTPSIETPDPPPAEPEKLRGGRLARRA
ncbi:hypothetical protein DK058_25045, partial [Salmonella enterica subsp. enterica serovar Typhi]|nr:hypothetical protein [Salmonella enterica subsp. enterica serovar Typhi]